MANVLCVRQRCAGNAADTDKQAWLQNFDQALDENGAGRDFLVERSPVRKRPIGKMRVCRHRVPEDDPVLSVELVTQEQALARARKELGEFSDVFDAQFLPSSLDVRLKQGFRDPKTVRKIVDQVREYDFVDDVRLFTRTR